MASSYSVPSLERALAIIELLAVNPKGCGITEAADTLGFPKNSAFRILKTLSQQGYVMENGRNYQLSPKLLALGYSALGQPHLAEKALDIMRDLRDELRETVLLGCIVGNTGVILEEVWGTHLLKVTIDVGYLFPLHTAAPGKAIIAYMNEEDSNKLIDHMEYNRYTERTILSKRQFRKEMERVVEKGFAVDHGEQDPELNCVAAPIFNHKNEPIASIWITGPATRLPAGEFDSFGAIVREHAQLISRRFGYEPSLNGNGK
jgi:DNA-binding IclR family transcriptional regulator